MIIVELTNEAIAGEPGPNFYWRGAPDDFLQLINDLHRLGRKDGRTRLLNNLNYVNVLHGYMVTVRSNEGKNLLCKVNGKDIDVDLDKNLWRRLLAVFLRISFSPSHDYVDLEDVDILEDANFIVSSESQV